MSSRSKPPSIAVVGLIACSVAALFTLGAGLILRGWIGTDLLNPLEPTAEAEISGRVTMVLAGLWAVSAILTGGALLLYRNLAEQATRQRIEDAMADSLTGLPNRTQFMNRLTEALATAGRHKHYVGVIAIDLDGFKRVNDTGGHAAGDRLLKRVGDRILEETRRGEFAARVGGDEFAVILPIVQGQGEVESLAGRIADRLNLVIDFGDVGKATVTASVGVATYPFDATDASSLVQTADAKMYHHKANRAR